MATPISHAFAALSVGSCFYRTAVPKRVWVAAALCSAIPDLDAIGFRFGVRYGDFWGHRGFTHSLVFAALLAGAVTLVFRHTVGITRISLFIYMFVATASHGLLDAMTNGGLGVAFLAPFDNQRFFLPWRPVRVSPIAVSRFFSLRAIGILKTELIWIWLPSAVFALAVLAVRSKLWAGNEKPVKVGGAGNRT
ncbi:MAG TPA: metal-dependent hydrolase [Terriglobales bacterium]|jgi:inner membrane protein|nr:metal-dependent hydrolase [Terriglobales bacterium]